MLTTDHSMIFFCGRWLVRFTDLSPLTTAKHEETPVHVAAAQGHTECLKVSQTDTTLSSHVDVRSTYGQRSIACYSAMHQLSMVYA